MHCGKQPDVQLCVQADAGTGSSHHLAALPARLNTALGVYGNPIGDWLAIFRFNVERMD